MLHAPRVARATIGLALVALVACRRDAAITTETSPGTGEAIVPAPSATAAPPVVSAVPPALTDASIYADLTFDAARTFEWDRALQYAKNLRDSAATLASGPNGRGSSGAALLFHDAEDAASAAASRDRAHTMAYANDATLVAAGLTEAYAPLVPADVERLAYGARELEVVLERAGGMSRLPREIDSIERTWARLRAVVVLRTGPSSAWRIDDLIVELRSATNRHDRARVLNLASMMLAATRVLSETLLRSPPADDRTPPPPRVRRSRQ